MIVPALLHHRNDAAEEMPATTHNASWSAHMVLWLPGAELHPAVAKDAAITKTAPESG